MINDTKELNFNNRGSNMNLKLYRRMLDSINEGIYFVDTDRRITFWNKGAEFITGFSAEDVTGTFCYNNLLNHVDEQGNKLCFNGCPLHQTLSDRLERSKNVFLHHKQGHRVQVEAKTMPLYDDQGVFIGSIELFSDESAGIGGEFSKDELQAIAFIDALSEIPNRRYGELQLKKLRIELEESGYPYSVAIADIDFFKKVNDTYGHDIGDEIIKIVAKSLRGALRSTDFVIRWGGEEFVMILRGLTGENLSKVLEKSRMLVENSVYRAGDVEVAATISIGGVTASIDKTNEQLIKIADNNLYKAKQDGRNRVVI